MLTRVAVILLAFLVASAAAGVAIALAILGPFGDAVDRGGFWMLAFLTAGFSGAVIILPMFLVVVLAESFRLRSVLLYALAGAAAMVSGYFMSGFAEHDATTAHLPMRQEAMIAAAAGIVFGFVYWLLAGRRAGAWRSPRV